MWLKICGAAILCVVGLILVRGARGDTMALQWTGTVVLFGATLLLWQPVLSWIGEVCAAHGMGETGSLLLRGLGVAVLTQLCAELCRQSGESGLALGVEGAGKAELLLLCLPMLRDLVETAGELLGGP